MSRSGIHLSVPEGGAAIDWECLDRATLGDAKLGREVLGLFDVQAEAVARTIADLPDDTRLKVHGLKGAARSVGAWRVGEAAQRLEASLASSSDPSAAVDALIREISAVRQVIAAHLRRA